MSGSAKDAIIVSMSSSSCDKSPASCDKSAASCDKLPGLVPWLLSPQDQDLHDALVSDDSLFLDEFPAGLGITMLSHSVITTSVKLKM